MPYKNKEAKLTHDREYSKQYYTMHSREKYLKKNRDKEREYWRRWYHKKIRKQITSKFSLNQIYRSKKGLFT